MWCIKLAHLQSGANFDGILNKKNVISYDLFISRQLNNSFPFWNIKSLGFRFSLIHLKLCFATIGRASV